jgi:hypothetical protein
MLILEIAAGVCLGILAVPALWLLATAIIYWYKEKRWWWGYKKHGRMVMKLSRRYARHLLEQDGIKVPRGTDPLKIRMPTDGGEGKFDPVAMAKIEELARRVDDMRDF